MTTDINLDSIITNLETTVKILTEVKDYGISVSNHFDQIYLVACGAPNRVMQSVKYWIHHYSPSIEVYCYFPAELVAQNPVRLNKQTLVILGSKSGTTPETINAAKFFKNHPCTTVGITQTENSPLAKMVDHRFLIGKTNEAHVGIFMILYALINGIMAGKKSWTHQEILMRSLSALPHSLGYEQMRFEKRTTEDARMIKDDRILYHVASGPMSSTAYVFAVCYLMEMQWMHSYPIEASEFFHGPFEIVDEKTPLILLLGEDPSRPLMERVVKFCKKYTERLSIYDSKEFEMKGIDKQMRPLLAPLFMQFVLNRIAERLAVWHNQPLTTRRYMWKTEY